MPDSLDSLRATLLDLQVSVLYHPVSQLSGARFQVVGDIHHRLEAEIPYHTYFRISLLFPIVPAVNAWRRWGEVVDLVEDAGRVCTCLLARVDRLLAVLRCCFRWVRQNV
jgi:hypothetical protein